MLTAESKLNEQPTLFLFIVLSYIAYLFHIPLSWFYLKGYENDYQKLTISHMHNQKLKEITVIVWE